MCFQLISILKIECDVCAVPGRYYRPLQQERVTFQEELAIKRLQFSQLRYEFRIGNTMLLETGRLNVNNVQLYG